MDDGRDWEKFVENLPTLIRDDVKAFPAVEGGKLLCYRITAQPVGHYVIASYAGNMRGAVLHGRDSFMPGRPVFGIGLDELTRCGCGKWEHATDEQLDLMRQSDALIHRAQRLGGFRK